MKNISNEHLQWASLITAVVTAILVTLAFVSGGVSIWAAYATLAVTAGLVAMGIIQSSGDEGWGWIAVLVVSVPVAIFTVLTSIPLWVGVEWATPGRVLYMIVAAAGSVGAPFLLNLRG